MSDLAKKFNKSFNTAGLKKDIAEAKENGGRREVPYDTYEVAVNKLELRESKKTNAPMVSCWFKILVGEYKGSMIFANFVITEGWQINNALNFLESLIPEDALNRSDIYFEDFEQFEDLLMNMAELIDKNYEYSVNYYEEKGYPRFEIKEIYCVE